MRDLRWLPAVALTLVLIAACGAPTNTPANRGGSEQRGTSEARKGGAITLAISGAVPSMVQIGTASTSSGGFLSSAELHSAPLVTSEEQTRKPIGRLAERVPSLENGDVTLLPDGRMRVLYPLRKGVTWHDGAPFTAHDLVFSFNFNTDQGIPMIQESMVDLIERVEALDDHQLVISFRRPYYQPNLIGLTRLWPQPRHILGAAYERFQTTKNADEILALPFWTTEYVNLGPFRVVSFDPGDTITLQAYDGYYLGKPKLDTIHFKMISDPNALYANLRAGTVDIFLENTLPSNLGSDLMERWHSSGEGTVYLRRSTQRMLAPQVRPTVQVEPTTFDVRVRAALYHALDRESLSEGLQDGRRELAAWEILAPGEPLHEITKDSLRRYAYDPDRARALLREAGWSYSPDGAARWSDGRRLRAPLTATSGRTGAQELAAIASYWRQVGAEVEELPIPAAQTRNAEFRALYPGWEASAQGGGDEILGRLEGPPASAQNRWIGNRGGYEDSRVQALIDTYRSSLTLETQSRAMKAIDDFIVDELPFLVLYSTAVHLGVSSRVKALEDQAGGDSAGRNYGSYSRNGHRWELR
jgi:peptide/nickel transport system substrate-binding protein